MSIKPYYCAEEMGEVTQKLRDREMVRIDRVKSVTDPMERQFFVEGNFASVLALPIQTRSGAIGAFAPARVCISLWGQAWKNELGVRVK
ncbi:hypothetical protein [Microseira sp. BLCC-F43]|uniref:hypothetical protein n=1 Tax=Microseira sp. BLCC-F43 TaxID=3153602 RepID=UPI0035BB9F74